MILHKPHDTKLDIWCIGVLVYELLVGKAPFFSKKNSETIEMIKKVQFKIPKKICETAVHLISRVKFTINIFCNKGYELTYKSQIILISTLASGKDTTRSIRIL